VAALLIVLMVSGALVTNEYYTLMLRNGGSQNWTDAIFTLSGYMKGVPSNGIYCADWGILDSLRLLNRGKLPLNTGTDPIRKPELSPEDRDYLKGVISDPSHVFIAHTVDYEFFQGVNAKLLRFAADAGYQRAMIAVIPDGWGRPVYEVYRFVGPGPVKAAHFNPSPALSATTPRSRRSVPLGGTDLSNWKSTRTDSPPRSAGATSRVYV
jgi:hypothetical protein